jgi:aspartyl-tRNA synthetase
MERTLIKDISSHQGEEISLSGWIDVRRDQGKMVFLDLRDRSGKVQAVVLPNHTEALEVAQKVRPEWVVSVTGKVNKRPEKNIKAGVTNGDVELEVLSIEIISPAVELPFSSDAELNLDTLLDYRPLTLRRERERAIFKVQSAILTSFREFLNSEGFTEFRAPAIVAGDAEGGC